MSSTDALPQFSAVEDILTQSTFHLNIGKHSFDVDVSICREKLTYRSVNGAKLKGESIAFTDIVGCRSIGGGVSQQSSTASGDGVPRKKETNHRLKLSEKSACLQVFSYKYNKNPKAGGVRRRVELNLVTDEFETQKENASLVEKWRLIILALLRGVEFSSIDGEFYLQSEIDMVMICILEKFGPDFNMYQLLGVGGRGSSIQLKLNKKIHRLSLSMRSL